MRRRDFVMSVAMAGGSAYAAMMALGLMEQPAAARTTKFQLRTPGRRTRVIILGAGLAGMTCAYELGKVGYDCVILEARARAGGRCWTVRGGDELTETDGQVQTSKLAKGQYFNPGPARIPQHHVTLDYCRELGVALEVFTNLNREQYYYNENVGTLSNTKVRAREAIHDMYGYISELLAKSINQSALDASLTADDQERMISFLTTWGGLNADTLLYTGTSRRGYSVPRGGGDNPGEVAPPYDLTSLLQLGFASYLSFEAGYDQQMIMFQPVGGMDQIARAFQKRVGRLIRFEKKVEEIRKLPENSGVRIVYSDVAGQRYEETADFCICTIPLSVLKSIPADFTPEVQEAIAAVPYAETGKIALQFNRRFWEEDENLYGGITSTNLPLTTIWYPSYGYGSKRGVIGGYYNFGSNAVAFGDLTPPERQARALELGSKIHGQYNSHFENSVSAYWPKVPYSLGGWASWTTETRDTYYPRLIEPDGRIYFCGEHVSYIGSWMAGAFESARLVSSNINVIS